MSGLEQLETRRNEIAALCRKYGVKRLRVFGSAVREDWDTHSSDYDFVADFGYPPTGVNLFTQQFGLIADLQDLLGRSVDVVDLQATSKANLINAVESEAVELYAA
ncbi:MAG: nucleotidyltransferase domain-containing protein [Armatimonadota bacterium]|nr:nucleotidyltransferase domain-containing protein [Armatimonadota bacterium]